MKQVRLGPDYVFKLCNCFLWIWPKVLLRCYHPRWDSYERLLGRGKSLRGWIVLEVRILGRYGCVIKWFVEPSRRALLVCSNWKLVTVSRELADVFKHVILILEQSSLIALCLLHLLILVLQLLWYYLVLSGRKYLKLHNRGFILAGNLWSIRLVILAPLVWVDFVGETICARVDYAWGLVFPKCVRHQRRCQLLVSAQSMLSWLLIVCPLAALHTWVLIIVHQEINKIKYY